MTRDRYLLPRTAREERRLRIQAELLAQGTMEFLDAVGVEPGMRCLDVGCGACDVMRLLAERVGPSGSVTGLDVDPRGERRVAAVQAEVAAPCDVVCGSITEPGPSLSDSYDVVFSRYLLHHLSEPVAAIDQMWGLTAEGGVLAIMDIDSRATTTYPRWQPYEEIEGLVAELFAHTGIDNFIGHKLPHLMQRSSAGDPDGIRVTGTVRPIASLAEFLELLLEMTWDQAIARGVRTAEQLEALRKDLLSASEQHDVYCDRPRLFGVWKRKQR